MYLEISWETDTLVQMREDLPDLKQLYPTFSPEQLAAAHELLDAYLLLAWEIWEEHSAGDVNPQLTRADTGSTIQAKVDSPQTN